MTWLASFTVPLWVIPIPVIAAAVIDWAIEKYRKVAAGRSRPPRGRPGGAIPPRVTIIRKTGQR